MQGLKEKVCFGGLFSCACCCFVFFFAQTFAQDVAQVLFAQRNEKQFVFIYNLHKNKTISVQLAVP